uniref:ARM repeat superfamily protein n=1 Tax=Populus trichocarpa TaxID=3694 RepID=B9HGV4_POPTR
MDAFNHLITTNLNHQNDDVNEEEEEEQQDIISSGVVFSQLKPYCLDLLQLLQNPNPTSFSSSIPSLVQFLHDSPPPSLQPFFDYVLFPLLLLLDAAVDSRKQNPKPHKISDRVAEGVVQCLEELLNKCYLVSIDQMVVLMKKLTYAAMLTENEASEEFREGVIKCFRALIEGLSSCGVEGCSCEEINGLPALVEAGDNRNVNSARDYLGGEGECLVSFLRSQSASAAVGHWFSLLLKAADNEVARGHRGSAKIRVEAFLTVRGLVAKIGTADALAFFLPGVVSQFAKVLHMSKTMISGAAGSVEAIDQAIRALAEYLMIVLEDDANVSSLDRSLCAGSGFNSNKKGSSIHSVLDELRQLPVSTQNQSKVAAENSVAEAVKSVTPASEFQSAKPGNEKGALHVDRTRDWVEETSAHVDRLLSATFPHICLHPARKVRQGLLAVIRGLLSKCSCTLKQSKSMFLECLFVLVVDECGDISAPAQEFLEYLLSSSSKLNVQSDVAELFSRLVEKLPKVVFGNDESHALSHAQQLLVVIYYSGPKFLMDHLQSPVTAARFLDIFALSLSQNSVFTGALDKLMLARPSSIGYLHSIAELKSSSRFSSDYQSIVDVVPSDNPNSRDIHGKAIQNPSLSLQDNSELPRMPPWFGSQKLYQTLAGILRLTLKVKGICQLSVIYHWVTFVNWFLRSVIRSLLKKAGNLGITGQVQANCCAREGVQAPDAKGADAQPNTVEHPERTRSIWKVSQERVARSHLNDCVGRIAHEYLSSEVWNLPIDQKSSLVQSDGEVEEITLHFFHDTAMLQQVIIDGIGIFSMCLGKDFASSWFLHSSLYLLLESLICSNIQVRQASDAVLHVLSCASGHPTVGQLVLANADYIIDSICRQLRHLDLNPRVPNVLASLLSYIGVAHKILPLLEEPMRSVSQELEILGRHQHPVLTIPFLKAVAEIGKASKHEASSLPTNAESYLMHVKSKVSDMGKGKKLESHEKSTSYYDNDIDMSDMESEQWENLLFKLNDSKRYRRTVGSIAGSCLTAAIPLLASMKQEECLVALNIVEDGIVTLGKVEEAYRHEKETKEAIEEVIRSYSLYQLQDTLDAAEEGTDENRLLPAMNKIWPFLVACVRNKNPVAVRRCLSVISSVVLICGGDFFSRRFHTDGPHFWKLLTTSPLQKKPFSKEDRTPLQLPYRSAPTSSGDSMSEISNLKVQVAVLNMIAHLSQNKRSTSALQIVLKKVSGLVVGIAFSGVKGLHDASINALRGLASIDSDLIWLLLADVYYALKKKDLPSPPISGLPQISKILPPPLSPKGYLYVQYGGQSFGFDIDYPSVETVFKKLLSQIFTNQLYI